MHNSRANVLNVAFALALLAVGLLASAPLAHAESDAGPRSVGSTLETHINNDGSVTVRGAKVTAVVGSTISAQQSWGSYTVSWNVVTNPSTSIIRRYGGTSLLSEISVGDYISFNGPLDTTKATATVNAKTVKDWSIQKRHADFSGSITSVATSTSSFVLQTKERGALTVFTSASTTITKDGATAVFADLQIGQKVALASGIWDTERATLVADKVQVKTDTAALNKRIFEGVIAAGASTTSPTTISIVVGGKVYTANIAANTTLLSKSWNPIVLSQILAGHAVRIYGAIQTANLSVIDAYIVRDTSIN
jgi:hypothetical protein